MDHDHVKNRSPLLGTRNVPWGDREIAVRELTLRERLQFPEVAKAEGLAGSIFWLCLRAVPEFRGKTADELDQTYSSEALSRLSTVIMQMSGLSKDDTAASTPGAP